MNKVDKLREILDHQMIDKDLRTKVNDILEDIELELEELNFVAERYKLDQRVNDNFVKKTVSLLEKSNEELKKSNTILIRTNTELSNSNFELERFAHIASHDLKTPLFDIIRFSGLLKQNIESNNYSSALEILSFIIKGGKNMNTLIENILKYSKLSKEYNLETEVLNLEKIINGILLSISKYVKLKNATVNILTPLPFIKWYRYKVIILFKNLIENGIKYNKSENPAVTISTAYSDKSISIYVKDNGIGIPKEDQKHLFSRFFRAGNVTNIQGTGLGLNIVKRYVEILNGEISFVSEHEVGTTFTIKIPYTKNE